MKISFGIVVSVFVLDFLHNDKSGRGFGVVQLRKRSIVVSNPVLNPVPGLNPSLMRFVNLTSIPEQAAIIHMYFLKIFHTNLVGGRQSVKAGVDTLQFTPDPDSNPDWRPCMCLSTIGSGWERQLTGNTTEARMVEEALFWEEVDRNKLAVPK